MWLELASDAPNAPSKFAVRPSLRRVHESQGQKTSTTGRTAARTSNASPTLLVCNIGLRRAIGDDTHVQLAHVCLPRSFQPSGQPKKRSSCQYTDASRPYHEHLPRELVLSVFCLEKHRNAS